MASKTLPSKENGQFRSIVKFYETKQYKKGLKAADAVLRKFPEHGETLAMRGLTLNCLNRKEEALDYVRRGLKHDVRSHVCWHVYGLICRSDHNYPQAIKCYHNALRIDPGNLQIMRDLYLLQIQTRDLAGFCDTRHTLLTLKPSNRNNWVGFAVGHHLNGNTQMAIDIVDKYLGTLLAVNSARRPLSYEDSELFLYKAQLLHELGRYEDAYVFLKDNETQITDKTQVRRKQAEYLLRQRQYTQAMSVYEELLTENADDYRLHRGVQCCLLETPELLESLTQLALPCTALEITALHPKSSALLTFYNRRRCRLAAKKELIWQRLPLHFTHGDDFKERLDRYLRHQLKRGIPSLGADLKFIYECDARTAVLETLVLSYLASLEQDRVFPSRNELFQDEVVEAIGEEESPMTLLWTMYLLALHYDRLGKVELALEWIEKCIGHTPTILDFYQRKGRMLKHAGDVHAAADVVVQGRLLDLADRYINNKATEYLLHADRIQEANETIALFTRHEGDPQQNLFDMQCMWYEIECGSSYLRTKSYGKALKKFFAVEKHFQDICEDQFDFHTYSIRKMTLRAYVQLLRFSDTAYSHECFQQAAHGAIQCYIALHLAHTHENGTGVSSGLSDKSSLSAAERNRMKKAQKKARKAEFKKKEEQLQQQKEAELKEASERDPKQKKNNKSGRDKVPKDMDPLGEALAEKPALEEAWRFVQILQKACPECVSTHLHAFDVAFHKEKYLLCLQALTRASALKVSTDQVHQRVIQLFHHLAEAKLQSVLEGLLQKGRTQLLSNNSITQTIELYVEANKQDMLHRLAAARCWLIVGSPAKAIQLLSVLSGSGVTHQLCQQAHELLRTHDVAAAEAYHKMCSIRFKYSSFFANGYRV